MSDKKESEKNAQPAPDFSNPICQDTFGSLPKIYGTIKNKVITNKINFYKNIKRKERVNLMKSFNRNQILQQTAKFVSPAANQKSANKSRIHKKLPIKTEQNNDIKKVARFEDKYHKFDTRPIQRHSRIVTLNDADDNQSKHKIKFNTIKFLPMLYHQDNLSDNHLHNPGKDSFSKSVSINTPLTNLYRQDKQKVKNDISDSSFMESEPSIGNRFNISKHKKETGIKERIKTEQGSSTEQNMEIRRSSLKTQFSKRIHDERIANAQLNAHDNKFHIPTRQEYKDFIKNYHPLNPSFNLKNLVKTNNFQIISYQDGTYFGVSELGLKNGEGVLVTENSIFQGIFKDDQKLKGFEQNIDGKYFGNFKNGQRQGKGRYEWNNGEMFEGEWKAGKKNGYGVWQSPNGDTYVGNWVNGRQHGTGTHTHKNSTYKGEFVNSLKHGYGEQSFANGDTFKGNYIYGKPQGTGRYDWTDGSYYEGDFKGGYRDGQGLLKQVDDSVYKVKALSEKILSTVRVNNHLRQDKDTRYNTIKASLFRRYRFKIDDLFFYSPFIQFFSIAYNNYRFKSLISCWKRIEEDKSFEFIIFDKS